MQDLQDYQEPLDVNPEDKIKIEPKNKPRPRSEQQQNLVKELYFGTAERTFRESSDDPDSLYNPYNPDDLYQKSGDYGIYEEMETDDQISVCMQLKEDLILGSGFEFVCEQEDHVPIKDDLERAFNEDAKRSFDEILSEILTSQKFGFSLSEKIFQTRNDGSLSIGDVKTRHPNTWRIDVDTRGNIKEYMQRAGNGGDIKVNKDSLIHLVNRGRFQNPYGRSDMREAYGAWFVKRHVTRMYSIFLEKAASPMPVGTYKLGKTEKADVDAAFNTIKKIQTKTAMMVPDVIDLEWLETSNTGEAFIKGLNIFNMFIGRSLLIPDLMGFQGAQTSGGAYSLGKEQIGLFARHIMRRRQALERAINKHLVWPIVVWNWGMVPHYPKFRLNPISEKDSLDYAKVFLEAVKGKVYEPTPDEINHFRSIIKFPESDDVKVFPSGGSSPAMPSDRNLPSMPGEDPASPAEEPIPPIEENVPPVQEEPPIEESKAEESAVKPKANEKKADFIEEDWPKKDHVQKTYIGEIFKETKGDYHKKVNFTAIENQLNAREKSISEALKPIYREVIADLIDQIKKKKVVEKQAVDKIEQVTVKKKFINAATKVMLDNLKNHYQDSKVTASNEIFKSNFTLPLPEAKFVELTRIESLKFVGESWAYDITRGAQQEIRNAIIEGRPVSSVIDFLNEPASKKESKLLTPREKQNLEYRSDVSLNRYARTKTTEIMNRARADFFEETGAVSGYQYSAIMDDRTSPICSGLHGKFFKKGSEPIPPLHFNCRSVLIPITVFEEFEPTKEVRGESVDSFIENNIGTGFSRK